MVKGFVSLRGLYMLFICDNIICFVNCGGKVWFFICCVIFWVLWCFFFFRYRFNFVLKCNWLWFGFYIILSIFLEKIFGLFGMNVFFWFFVLCDNIYFLSLNLFLLISFFIFLVSFFVVCRFFVFLIILFIYVLFCMIFVVVG